jgi:hypothetical protein
VTHLAVFLPGAGYRHEHPLFWVARSALRQVGAAEVLVSYPETPTLAEIEDLRHPFYGNVRASLRAALDEHRPDRVTLVGKSLGTLALGEVVRAGIAPDAAAIWLTPIWAHGPTFDAARTAGWRSLFAVGTADPTYVPERQAALEGDVLVVDGGNHSLEVEGDVLGSVAALQRLATAVLDFVR